MKKLGQKLSFLTKILLVVGLLISNLSSLSIVFAYEVSDDLVIELVDNVLEIAYTEQVAEEVETVNVKVYENYSYSEDLSENEVVTEITLSEEQLLSLKEGTLELTHSSIFNNGEEVVSNYEIFDGTYSVKVEIIDLTVYEEGTTTEVENVEETVLETENVVEINVDETLEVTAETTEVEGTVIALNTYEKEMVHESGLNIKLFDATTNEEITLVDGKYPVSMDSSKVKVVAQILSGGLKPNDVFKYNTEEFNATEIINKEFSTEVDFIGRLYGEYEIPVEVKLLKTLPVTEETVISDDNTVTETTETVTETSGEVVEETEVSEQYEEVIYTDSINVLYESYEANSDVLNSVALSLGYGEGYLFYSEDKDGNLYVFSEFEEETTTEVETDTVVETVVTKTMLDLYNILKTAVGDVNEDSPITYTLLKNGINVLESYDETTGVSLEDYLSTIVLDDTVVATISNDGLSITYNVVMIADLNNDNLLTEDDLLELIDQAVGASEITDISKSDLVIDEKVDTFDVLYLNQVIDSKSWEVYGSDVEETLDSSLNVLFNDAELSEENYLTSGDEFTVDYVLSLSDYDVNGIAGLFDYDKTLFELVSLNVNYDWIGNNHEGKFLYLGGEVLTKPELEETTPETETPETEENVTEGTETSTDTTTDETVTEVVANDYVVLTATFKALKATEDGIITLKDIELFNTSEEDVTYYVLDLNTVSTDAITVTASTDNALSYLEVAGVEITLEDGVYEYEITVDNEVTSVDLKYILNNVAASVTSEVYPEELAEGSNSIVVTVTSESGVSQSYTITVVREAAPETTTQVNNNYYYDNNTEEDTQDNEVIVNPGDIDDVDDDKEEEKDGNLSRIIIIILILIVIAGLVYLIFKDDDDDETKKANKDINKLKKNPIEPEVKETVKNTTKTTTKSAAKTVSAGKATSKTTSKSSSSKSKGSKNKNKER